MRHAGAVIVGSLDDPHLTAVLAAMPDDVLTFDASTLGDGKYSLADGGFEFEVGGRKLSVSADRPVRGWIRRLAPPEWQRGVVIESREAATKGAWLSLLTGVIRTCGVTWLTGVDPLIISESKLVQDLAARQIGVRMPQTIVTNDRDSLMRNLPDEMVIKSLGPGHFYDQDRAFVLFTTPVQRVSEELDLLGSAPFLVQERLRPRRHLRLVTVQEQVWGAELDAANRPLDWRSQQDAHHSFVAARPPSEVRDAAIAIASQLNLGYSSQDWLLTEGGPVLLDVNPAGQWMFLPSDISEAVTHAIAAWLLGRPR